MTMQVTTAAAPRALQRARRRRPAAPARIVPAPVMPRVPMRSLPAEAPAQVKSPEYASSDPTAVIGDVSYTVTEDMLKPLLTDAVGRVLDPERYPYLGSTYGKVIPGKVVGVANKQAAGLVGGVITDALRGVLHGRIPGVEQGAPGIGWSPTPPNKLLAGFAKGVATSWMKLWLGTALAPPPPPPAPVYPPDVKPLPPKPLPPQPAPRTVLGQPIKAVLDTAAMGVVSTAIAAVYDQVAGPLVQRAANVLTGRGDEPIAAPAPLTPGKVASGFVDSVLGSLLVRSVTFPTPPPGIEFPVSATLGTSIINGIVGAAWSTVYGRGLAPAIENGVNELAGLRSKEEVAKSPLPAFEHFTRAAARGVGVGATTYLLGQALSMPMMRLGASIGGIGGALVALGGAALIGAVGGSIVDATVGPMLGRLGGSVASWITGTPSYEQRMSQPGPEPGSPVNSPNGNPGTVPAPSAPVTKPAPSPAAGRPRRRRSSGNAAVDRTAPAARIAPGRLAVIAARG